MECIYCKKTLSSKVGLANHYKICKKKDEYNELQIEIKRRTALESSLKLAEDKIKELETHVCVKENVNILDQPLNELENSLVVKDKTIHELENSLVVKDQYIKKVENRLVIKDQYVKELEKKINELEHKVKELTRENIKRLLMY
jgi:hypothetical protein